MDEKMKPSEIICIGNYDIFVAAIFEVLHKDFKLEGILQKDLDEFLETELPSKLLDSITKTEAKISNEEDKEKINKSLLVSRVGKIVLATMFITWKKLRVYEG